MKLKEIHNKRTFLTLPLALILICCFAHMSSAAQTQEQILKTAVDDFEALRKDNHRGMQRESWEKLQTRFENIEKLGSALACESMFYQARSREELAERSKNRADRLSAVTIYAKLTEKYPEHPLAGNACYNWALILAGPLRDNPGAVKALDQLIKQYPSSNMFNDAVLLQNKLVNAATPAPASGKTQPTAPTVQPPPSAASVPANPPSSQNATAQKQLYDTAAANWRNLTQPDNPKVNLRASWLKLEADFKAALEKAPAGPLADKAAFQIARSREELASRSFNRVDWEQATVYFAACAAQYPSSHLADDSLYAQAAILAQKLSRPDDAKKIARQVLDQYPSGDMVPKAKTLLQEIAGQSSGDTDRPKATTAPATGARGAPPSTIRAPSGNIAEQLGLGINTVVIDAGHGGKDPGAHGNGIKESKYTLELAKMVGQRLQKQGLKVLYTRDSDKYIALEDRTSFANNRKADIFISIHVNSSNNKNLTGLETYYLDVARSDAAAVVAARENSVSVNQTNDLQFILSDLTRNTKRDESLELASTVQRNTLQHLSMGGFKVNDNGVRSAPFYVLMGARMPAFLIEIGYLSNGNDLVRLRNSKYMERLADGISAGIMAYKKKLTGAKI